ncbi:hypothetical protein AAFF_G00430540 [Aldrovandia affinis]|uniref:Uncharacterized protein n=1 Tax=Aldrovandia affinis TaxID=143900 RepID=A0AAD7S932_9TELE|nr:hypothetical protein AAFF_G00430540 [Aldrovandia affinis]
MVADKALPSPPQWKENRSLLLETPAHTALQALKEKGQIAYGCQDDERGIGVIREGVRPPRSIPTYGEAWGHNSGHQLSSQG